MGSRAQGEEQLHTDVRARVDVEEVPKNMYRPSFWRLSHQKPWAANAARRHAQPAFARPADVQRHGIARRMVAERITRPYPRSA